MKNWAFFSYFFKYIIFSKTRQRLLFIAVVGLFLSAFSLLVIQGIMGGLQKGLISRSKFINGSYILKFDQVTAQSIDQIKDLFLKEGLPFISEFEVEVMIKNRSYVSPVKLHGIDLNDERPGFLSEKDFTGLVLGSDLASKTRIDLFDEIQVISPGVTDSLLGEVPRSMNESVTGLQYTELPEVDEFEGWVRLEMIQNLMRQKGVNQIRVFGELNPKLRSSLDAISAQLGFRIISWEEMNQALVWSLNLETKVMLFLFISMSLLVAIAITSGLLIFYAKIRRDLMSFWILGMAQENIVSLSYKFTLFLSAVACCLGGLAGYGSLRILESYAHDIMPDIFIEREFPIELTVVSLSLSLFIPFGISLIFSYLSFANFRKENQSFVTIIRSVS
jgi:lipoprotein-releasing system permease protein